MIYEKLGLIFYKEHYNELLKNHLFLVLILSKNDLYV